MTFITQLVGFLTSPLGAAGAIIGLILLHQAGRSARWAWLLVSLYGFAATLGKFQSPFIPEPPALVFPLQQLRELGRPLTMALLGLLCFVAFQRNNRAALPALPWAIRFLLGVHLVIFLKNFSAGSLSYALLALVTIGAIVVAVMLGPARWLEEETGFRYGVGSLAAVGVIFVALNTFQATFSIYPLTFIGGRFLGTTPNPQQAAITLAVILPSLMFFLESQPQAKWTRLFWSVILALVICALIFTGSRTGWAMGVATLIFFYRHKLTYLLRLVLLVGVMVGIIWLIFGSNLEALGVTLATTSDRFFFGEDTRQFIWPALWRNFQAYPIFGVPLRGDRLLGYGESSWLGAASSLGVVGLLPLSLFGLSCLLMMGRLFQFCRMHPDYFLAGSTVIAGLAALLVGSVFEAILLGNLTFYTMALLLYLVMGQHLLATQKQPVTNSSRTSRQPLKFSRSTQLPVIRQ